MAINLTDRARAVIDGLATLLRDELRKSLIKKGHKNTGKLLDSIEVKVKASTNQIILEGIFEDYGVFQDTGVPSDRIRHGRKAIDALEEWVRRKLGVPADKSRGVAFAISKTHSAVGMHSKNKKANPSAAGWMTDVLNSEEGNIGQRIEEAFDVQINVTIDNIIREFEK